MLLSVGLILLLGFFAGKLAEKVHLPALVGMLITGILIGPGVLNWIDPSMQEISGSLRTLCLLVILIRAGLNLKIEDLKKAGRPALLMTFVPATFEILGYLILAPLLLGFSWAEAAVLGCVIAAVSPAVAVPGMVKVMEEGYGQDHAVAPMILAGASADDIYVIVLFGIFSSIAAAGTFDASLLLRIPTSILLGIAAGFGLGWLLSKVNKKLGMNPSQETILFLSCGALLYALENWMNGPVGFSGLIAVMAAAMNYARLTPKRAAKTSASFTSLWSAAQIFLFVLIGAAIKPADALPMLGAGILLILGGLVFRTIGVYLCTLKSHLNVKERLFCIISYLPKATVQAAIGGIPLAMGLACGPAVLAVAVLAILITAPIGAALIDLTYKKLLNPTK